MSVTDSRDLEQGCYSILWEKPWINRNTNHHILTDRRNFDKFCNPRERIFAD
jgi:hypothetical protein